MPIRLDEIDIPPSWQRALDELRARPGVIMVLGALDTGKSTLVQVVIHSVQQAGRTVGWVDCDVGQSDLGPPTTIGLAIVTPSTDVATEVQADAMRFVGSTSPSGHLLPMVTGTLRMMQLAEQRNAEAIVINTTGMVYGGSARALNMHLLDVVKPDDILALQAQSEIEHLLRPIERQGRSRLHRLPVSQKVRHRSREARRQIRQERFRAYFQNAVPRAFVFAQLSLQDTFLGSGRRLSQKQLADASTTLDAKVVYGERCADGLSLVIHGGVRGHNIYIVKEVFAVEHVYAVPLLDFEHRLVGLCDASNDLLALGLIQRMNWMRNTFHILTPLAEASLEHVKVVRFGSIRVDRSGVEYSIEGRS